MLTSSKIQIFLIVNTEIIESVDNSTIMPLDKKLSDPMSSYTALQHVFLIAMPKLRDPLFAQSVVYLWEYNADGATGVIINRPMGICLGELLQQLDVTADDARVQNYPVLCGGPVMPEQGFIIRRHLAAEHPEEERWIEVTVSSSKHDLLELAHGEGLGDTLVTLGCADWAPGQLDRELANNDWLVVPFSEATLFGDGGDGDSDASFIQVEKWHMAAARAGIDLNRLSSDVGHG